MSVTLRAKELPITLRALAQDEGTRQRDFMVLAIPAYQSISGGSIEQTLGAIQVERTPYEEGGGYRTRSPVILVHDFTGRYWFGVANPEAAPGAGYDFKTVDQVARACDHWLQVIEAERQAQVHEQLNLETREAQRQAAAAALEAQPLPPPGTHLVNEDLGITAELICVAPEGTVYARVLEVVRESDTVYPGRVLAVGQEGRLWGGFHPVAANLGTTMLMPRAPLEVRYGGGSKKSCQVPISRLELTKTACADLSPTQASSPEAIVQFVKGRYDCSAQEVALLVGFDPRMQVLGVQEVSQGGLSMAAVDPRVVFAGALAMGAAAIVLIHNHPSGNPDPSSEDVRLTAQLVAGAQQLGIRVLDHIVVGRGGAYASLQAQGLMPRAGGA